MKNLSRNLFLALSAICAIALIVFFVQLIILNSGGEPSEPESIVSGGSSRGSELSDGEEPVGTDGSEEPGGSVGGDEDELYVEEFQTPRPPAQGTRHEIRVDSDNVMSLYAQEEVFEFTSNELDWSFVYLGGGNAALEISFVFMSLQGAAVDAEIFLNAYTGGNDADFRGTHQIHGSPISGYHVFARGGTTTYEAWIHPMVGSDLGLAFLIYYDNSAQMEALYTLLSSLDMSLDF